MVEMFQNLNKKEKFIYKLRNLLEDYGYKNISVNLLEDYESYKGSHLIKDENILKLIHPNGKLYALRPDMTIPIAKRFALEGKKEELSHKVYYNDSVFRIEQKSFNSLSEMQQMGVEALGVKDKIIDFEIITLAKEILSEINETYHIDLSHSGILEKLFSLGTFTKEEKEIILAHISKREKSDLEKFLGKNDSKVEVKESLIKLLSLNGSYEKVMEEFKKDKFLNTFEDIIEDLSEFKDYLDVYGIKVDLDFSLSSNLKYYTGIIFKGYVPNIAEAVLTGGRYDKLSKTFGKDMGAIGFGVNLTEILQGFEEGNRPRGAIVFYEDQDKALIEVVKNLRESKGLVRLEKNIDLSENLFKKLKFEYDQVLEYKNGRLEEKTWK